MDRILNNMDRWSIRRIPKEMNQMIDYIVEMTFDRTFEVQIFRDVPEQLGVGFMVT